MNEQQLKAVRRAPLVLLMAGMAISQLSAECTTHVWDTSQIPAHPSWLEPFIPAGTQSGFAAQLNSTDWLITYQFEHDAGDKGAFYKGFVIVRNGTVLRQQSLMSVSAWKRLAKKLGYSNMPGFTIYVAQVCDGRRQLDAVGFGVCCTASDGILFFVAAPERDFYRITVLPIVGGGKLEISQTFPASLRLWSEAGDGKCDGCLQHYTVSEYSVIEGKPTFVRQSTTSQQFEPGEFDAHRIVLLPVSH
jgi:hypothetical protein